LTGRLPPFLYVCPLLFWLKHLFDQGQN
jgi:hypothetical protein